jgi:pimeloyl-ACP methyl ester carboxylesterase
MVQRTGWPAVGYRLGVSSSALALAPDFQHEFVEANGLRFHVASCGEGERLALFLHGFPEGWFSWRHQMPVVARLGWRAWAPDLRGYGSSDRPGHWRDYAIENLLADVAGLIDASGAKSTMILCHDWGGLIGWQFAMQRIRPLERLVVMNLPHPLAAREAFGFRQLLRSWYALFFQIPWLPEKLLGANGARAVGRAFQRSAVDPTRFPDELVAVFAEEASRPGALKAMIDYYRALVRGGGGRRLRALRTPNLEIPTLLLWGEEDVALGVELTHATHRYVDDLTLRHLPGVGHFVQQEAPETVNTLLEAWLSGETVPEAPGP